MLLKHVLISILCLVLAACSGPDDPPQSFDILIRNGAVYTGDGGEPLGVDIAIRGDRIAAIGDISGTARQTIDASGLAVAPGFINMLS
jgi:N-acyl-D-amino-acid deacylase